jgi:hypothetical protein
MLLDLWIHLGLLRRFMLHRDLLLRFCCALFLLDSIRLLFLFVLE